MEKIISTRIINKHDTADNWVNNNPLLLDGELIFVVGDNGELQIKLGDGESSYTGTPFIKFRDIEMTGTPLTSTAPVRDTSLHVASTAFVRNALLDAVNFGVVDGILNISMINDGMLNNSMSNVIGVATLGNLVLG